MSKFTGLYIVSGFIGLCLDQYTKHFAIEHSWAIYNSGVAFGIFSDNNTLMIVISLIVIVGLAIFGWFHPHKLPICLLTFAAFSNLIDRLRFGAVIDWLPIPGSHITNNLADWIISLSLIWLLIGYTQQYASNKHYL